MIGRHPLIAYFGLSYALSWLIWAPLWLPALGIEASPRLPYHHAFGALGPIAAAFIVSGVESGRAGVDDLLRRMVLWRGRPGWIAVACVAPVVLLAIAIVAARITTGEHVSVSSIGRSREFPQFSAFAFFAYNIISFGYGEEVGWRGFALPRLQTKHSALASSLMLTAGWAIWHIPLFLYRPGYTTMSVAGVAGWLFSLVTGSVLLTWLYNGSRGSLLVVAIFHAAIDVVFTSTTASAVVVNTAGALITVWGVIVVISAGPAYLSRHGKMVSHKHDGAITRFLARDPHFEPAPA